MVCCSFEKATGYNDDGNRVCDFYLGIESFYFRQIIDCYDNRDVSMKRPDETGSYLLLLYELYSQQEKRNDVRKRHNKLFLSFSFVLPIMCFVKLSVSYALLFFNCRNKLL